MNQTYALTAVAVVVLATVLVGSLGLRISRTTSDFYVASRTVGPRLNAAAISGEYLSAASFLGVAGLVLLRGPEMLWYPVGYTAGYLVLLVLVAAPLRRSGAYTLPDFAEARLESRAVRRIAVLFVLGVGWLYLLPQLQGAGLTLEILTGAPHWVGGVVVACVVTVAVAAGGMRSITFVQAFQYWLKLTALLVPVFFLLGAWVGDGAPRATFDAPAVLRAHTAVTLAEDVRLSLDAPLTVTVTGQVDGRAYAEEPVTLGAGQHVVRARARLAFAPDSPVPGTSADAGPGVSSWSEPLSGDRPELRLYATYGLVLATFLGTMGLPHVAVRFYTSPNGRAARRTTSVVLGLVGAFYLLPPVYGALGRIYAPELALTREADAALLVLPARMVGGLTGELLGALLAGGAFAAFLSTASGLTMAVAGVLHQDVLPSRGVRSFRVAVLVAILVPLAGSVAAADVPAADAVGLAFAVSASSFCPLLVLGIWWRGLTPPGAVAGLVTGGGAALSAVLATRAGLAPAGWANTLLAWPAVWSVPLGFLTMVVMSLATPARIPAGTAATLARLHLPEEVASGAASGAEVRVGGGGGAGGAGGRRHGRGGGQTDGAGGSGAGGAP
ncbi:cation acetate symporter [Streptomyces sp. NPDC006544]|uniref:sodium/solute symporter n=1 Tax=Streptomyces sp. NPDC006544 TaxID=3154583 RepID=UPI0033A69554